MLRRRSELLFKTGLLAVILAMLFIACTGKSNSTPAGINSVFTQAAETLQVQQTETNRPPATPTALVPFRLTPLATSIYQTLTPPGTTPGLPLNGTVHITPAAEGCNAARFISDVSIPDGSEFAPGASFVKTWRLKNTGTCTWTSAYALVFTSGNKMDAPDVSALTTGEVAPDGTVDITVNMKAPSTGGTHRGEFKLRDAGYNIFGVSEQDDPFWVEIKVTGPPPELGFDFVSQSRQAAWSSESGTNPGALLTFGGASDDPNGSVAIQDGQQLETGAVSGKILATFPKPMNDGYITGVFPAYTVQAGDHFKARLGLLMNANGACGVGKVLFQFGYLEGTIVTVLDEWTDTCDGDLVVVDVNLAQLVGKPVQFVFTVRTLGTPQEDWAIWNSPRIER